MAGLTVGLFCKEKRRELCESTERVCDFFWERLFNGVEGQIVVLSLRSSIEDLLCRPSDQFQDITKAHVVKMHDLPFCCC